MGFLPQIVTFLRYISRKWSQKIVEYICFEGKKAVRVPSIARCLAKSGGTNYTTVPPPEILGDSSPRPPWSTALEGTNELEAFEYSKR